jgi:hypothetical protein
MIAKPYKRRLGRLVGDKVFFLANWVRESRASLGCQGGEIARFLVVMKNIRFA